MTIILRYQCSRVLNQLSCLFSQVGETWRSFSREEQKKIIGRLSNDLVSVDLEIQARLVKELGKADPKYAKMLVKALQKSFLVEEPDT